MKFRDVLHLESELLTKMRRNNIWYQGIFLALFTIIGLVNGVEYSIGTDYMTTMKPTKVSSFSLFNDLVSSFLGDKSRLNITNFPTEFQHQQNVADMVSTNFEFQLNTSTASPTTFRTQSSSNSTFSTEFVDESSSSSYFLTTSEALTISTSNNSTTFEAHPTSSQTTFTVKSSSNSISPITSEVQSNLTTTPPATPISQPVSTTISLTTTETHPSSATTLHTTQSHSTTTSQVASEHKPGSTSTLTAPSGVYKKPHITSDNTLIAKDTSESNEIPSIPGIPGIPGKDFPFFGFPLPKTEFRCRKPGYFGDPETRCQMFHICQDFRMDSFLCPNGTVFDQRYQVCNWWFSVRCPVSPSNTI
ncbi:uncharacterized protein LOC143238895 [Tachypleus tridentatus]|uniref:uncharacterized protein LOC143238895 n=1 Tax=Tachypleus tridentatus TaxID=6853 RepID=UPI003FD5B674